MVATGVKIVETRTHPLDQQFLNKLIYIWEKPKNGQAQVIGVVRFVECFRYKDREAWAADYSRHQVRSMQL